MVNENKSKVFAAVAGIVVGAGAAIAGAVALSDKNNQKKVKEVLSKAKSMANDYSDEVKGRLDDARNEIENAKDEVRGNIDKSKNTVKKVASKSIDSAIKVAQDAKKKVSKV